MTIFAIDKHPLTGRLADLLDDNLSLATWHHFPDGESCIRIDSKAVTDTCIVTASLDRPDAITLPLLFLARTLRDYGAKRIILVAPYLAYMRQDKCFHSGEGVTARYYADLLSDCFDALVTVDPHLHRIHELDEIYSIPSVVVEAAASVADWIMEHVERPMIIGPDSESEQWAAELAKLTKAPYLILQKTRHGDRDVCIDLPNVERWRQYTPVLFDDIISTARTMLETIENLKRQHMSAPLCIGVHAVFADDAYTQLQASGVRQVVTCNTLVHESNNIDMALPIVNAVRQLL